MIEKSEPGAAQYGNFINYYQFNPASNRMTALSDEFWTNFSKRLPENVCCLDVGCNSGELSFALCERLKSLGKNCVFLCLDIDSVLIQRSIENFSFEPALTFKTLDITNVEDQKEITNFLGKWGKLNFDLIFCFSTTLWIHINYGDDVLLNTIKYLCGMTNNLVIEPQAWKSYRQAVRRVRKLAKNIFDDKFSQLKIRSDVVDVIGKIISEAGFELHEVGVSEWKRQILVCEKRYP